MGYVNVDTGNVMLNTIGAILKAPSRRSPRSSHPEFDSVTYTPSMVILSTRSSVILSVAKDLLFGAARNATAKGNRPAIAAPRLATEALDERRGE